MPHKACASSTASTTYIVLLSRKPRLGEGDRHILLRGLRKMSQSPRGFPLSSYPISSGIPPVRVPKLKLNALG